MKKLNVTCSSCRIRQFLQKKMDKSPGGWKEGRVLRNKCSGKGENFLFLAQLPEEAAQGKEVQRDRNLQRNLPFL